MSEKILIKKYANRRLYDTNSSVYVTLEQVAEMIRRGSQVEVRDAKTREDVTAFILTQIVLERARNKRVLLPVPLLHLIIQYGENILEEFFEKYLEQILKNYLSYKAAFDEQFENWLNLSTNLSRTARETLSSMAPFQAFSRPFSGSEETKKKDGPAE
ncbi:MAG: polyhydroxyalkanoate synthesis regulator DNA-binding domain-containing protein [Deltaproteobacteria bacterium]|nr:polyhydroxyalkanoate synthesis regulator DNA-binding domain-containing protein [Deltaproteobacteria bacterium]